MRCPKCKQLLIQQDRQFVCSNNHSYDIAKQGYVNLLLKNSSNHGDNKQMVAARSHFLNQDHYLPLAKHIIKDIKKLRPQASSLLDLGCGQGYYTNQFQLALPKTNITGIDISKEAVSYASRQNKQIQYIVASNADLPLADETIDIALCLFSFVDAKEAWRVLSDDGLLIVVNPHERHLFALKEAVYDTPYLNEVKVEMMDGFELIAQEELTYAFHLSDQESIKELFSMTPYSYKTSIADIGKLDQLHELDVEASFSILTYQKIR